MSARFYFYTVEGKEIESKFSQLEVESMGSGISIHDGKKWKFKKFDTFIGQLKGKVDIGVFKNLNVNYDYQKITIEDFEHDIVVVKYWCPNEDCRETFVLTSLEEGEELAEYVRMF